MADIYREALASKFEAIMDVIGKQYGFDSGLNGLTVEARGKASELAEQAILDWSAASANTLTRPRPCTNLQHLLLEYCAIARHIAPDCS